MKNSSSATQEVAQVVNPLFIDVLTQLGDIKNQISAYYHQNKVQQELCEEEFFSLDPLFYAIACKIGAMSQAEMIDNTLFKG